MDRILHLKYHEESIFLKIETTFYKIAFDIHCGFSPTVKKSKHEFMFKISSTVVCESVLM